MRALRWAVVALLCGPAALAALAPAAAYPGEPTVSVSIFPPDVTVDASGVNAVDTVFFVNLTASNQVAPRPHMMWVNISFTVDLGWAVNPPFDNLTYTLAAQESVETSIAVTVTVPPGASATTAAIFSAAYEQDNDMPFAQGQAGNRTAQIHIRQVFSTGASFTNGTSSATAEQGQDASYNITVQNNGNGDAEYDAKVLNADELRPNDITVQGTAPALVPQGGNAVVRVTLHANPAAIPGTYPVQVRVFATAAGEDPPPGAYADITGTLNIRSAAPPPPTGNNTTNPPPPTGNNTTGGGGNPPPPKDLIAQIVEFVTSPPGLLATALLVAIVAIAAATLNVRRARRRRRQEQLERARAGRRRGAGAPAGPVRMTGPPREAAEPAGPGGAMRPVRRGPGGPVPRPSAQDLKRRGST